MLLLFMQIPTSPPSLLERQRGVHLPPPSLRQVLVWVMRGQITSRRYHQRLRKRTSPLPSTERMRLGNSVGFMLSSTASSKWVLQLSTSNEPQLARLLRSAATSAPHPLPCFLPNSIRGAWTRRSTVVRAIKMSASTSTCIAPSPNANMTSTATGCIS
jgi:hypothetical protein